MGDIESIVQEETQENYRYALKIPTSLRGFKVEVGENNSLAITMTSSQNTAHKFFPLAGTICNKVMTFFQYDKGDIAVIFPKKNTPLRSIQMDDIGKILREEIQDKYRYTLKIPTTLRGFKVEVGDNNSLQIKNSLQITVTSSRNTTYRICSLADSNCNVERMFFQFYKGNVTVILPKENRSLDSNHSAVSSIGLCFLIK